MWAGHQRKLGDLANTGPFYVESDCMSYCVKHNQHVQHANTRRSGGMPSQKNVEYS